MGNMNKDSKSRKRKAVENLFDMYAEEIYEQSCTEMKLIKEIIEKQENFEKNLTEEQKQQYEQLCDLKNKSYAVSDKNIFVCKC